MRVVETTSDGRLELRDRPLPEPAGSEVRIDVAYCGICGTDLHLRDSLPAGAVLGHEFAGTIGALGPAVKGWSVGEEVVAVIYGSCGSCRYCRAGEENHCLAGGHHGEVIGVQRAGGYAEAVLADAAALERLPAGMALRHAALAEPVSIGVHAARAAALPREEPLLVIGAGPIGLFVALGLRAEGHTRVLVAERNPTREAVAARLGFATLPGKDLAAELRQGGVEELAGAVECAAAPAAARAIAPLLRRRGRLVLVGLPGGDVCFDAETLVLNEIEVRGAAGTARADFRRALELIHSGAIPADEVITSVVALEDADAAFARLRDPSTTDVKVLLQP